MPTRTILLAVILSGVLAFSLYLWAAPPPQLVLRMTPSGDVVLNGEDMTSDEALVLVRQSIENDPETTVLIQAGPNLPAGEVIRLTQEVQSLGVGLDVETSMAYE